MKIALCVLMACVASCAGRERTFSWRREVETYEGDAVFVEESTVVTVTENSTLMLMTSADEGLRRTPVYRSESLHDFRMGLLALKPVGSKHCYLGSVFRRFRTTLRELRRRSQRGNPASSRRRFSVKDDGPLETSGSSELDNFCSGMTFLSLQDEPQPAAEPVPRYPPLYCIWGPIDIEYPNGQVPDIENFQGGFGFFP